MVKCQVCGIDSSKKPVWTRSSYWGNDRTCYDCALWVSDILKRFKHRG